MPTYIIADVTRVKTTTKTINADNDAAALRMAQEYVDQESTSESVTLFLCEGEKRVITVGEVHRRRPAE